MTPAVPLSQSAARMRRHRQRRRKGLRCLRIDLHEMEIDELIRKGLLKWETRNDQNEIVKAIYKHFDRTLSPML